MPKKKNSNNTSRNIVAEEQFFSWVYIFRDRQGRPYARVSTRDSKQIIKLNRKVSESDVRMLVALVFGESSDALVEQLSRAISQRIETSPTEDLCVRTGWGLDGFLYLDLNSDGWTVRMGPGLWELTQDSPVNFLRHPGMGSLPKPESRGDLRSELNILGITNSSTLILVAAYLIGLLNPSIALSLLLLVGSQGSSKSTKTRQIRSIVDPHCVPARSLPSNMRDLMIAADHCWILAYDNVSVLPNWLSDALCCLSTGAGYATRTLYSDDKETYWSSRRPIILNSILHVVDRPDLLDRTITIQLPVMPATDRKLESVIQEEFAAAHPYVLGALLDCVCFALDEPEPWEAGPLSRMADFHHWVLRAEPAMGFTDVTFNQAYEANRAEQNRGALEACPIGQVIIDMANKLRRWRGTPSQLYREVHRLIGGSPEIPNKSLPTSPDAFGKMFKRIEANLLAAGIEVDYPRASDSSRTL